MSVSSAKAKLDAQGGDPVTGYISKTDVQESYDELVNATALTGTTTAAAITCSGAVQAAAASGFVLGASGPKFISGSGSPLGAVSAPVGSIYVDTAVTTGAAQWVKISGTGNTGWMVSYGDTGWRDITASITAGVQTSNPGMLLYVRRTNSSVFFRLRETSAGSATGTITVLSSSIPTGFGISAPVAGPKTYGPLFRDDTAGLITGGSLYVDETNVIIFGGTAVRQHANLSWTTAAAWPTSLPGSAA